MLSACLVIYISFGLIQTVPLTYKQPFFQNYDSVDYNEMVRATRNLNPKLVPESLFLRSLESNRNLNDASVYREGNDLIRVPTLESDNMVMLDTLPPSSYFEHGIRAALPLEYGLITQNEPSPIMWNSRYLRTPQEMDEDDPTTYQADQGLNTGSVNVEVDPYEVDLYPFVHTSISAALNPGPPVHTLPPVYATQIHETMPLENRGDYDIDVLNPENSELMPPNLRITRSRRDFLEDLAHDTIMNNLLPTMSVPFVRGAEISPSYQVPQQALRTGQAIAVYPRSAVKDCAIPLLLRCSPNIVRGTLSSTYAEQSPPVSSGVAYRDEKAKLINKNAFKPS